MRKCRLDWLTSGNAFFCSYYPPYKMWTVTYFSYDSDRPPSFQIFSCHKKRLCSFFDSDKVTEPEYC